MDPNNTEGKIPPPMQASTEDEWRKRGTDLGELSLSTDSKGTLVLEFGPEGVARIQDSAQKFQDVFDPLGNAVSELSTLPVPVLAGTPTCDIELPLQDVDTEGVSGCASATNDPGVDSMTPETGVDANYLDDVESITLTGSGASAPAPEAVQ